MSGLFGVTCLAQGRAQFEDNHGAVECQVVKLLTQLFSLLVNFMANGFDTGKNVQDNLNSILA